MVRVISLKSLLLFLMVVVVCLTLIFIVRCSSTPSLSFDGISLTRKSTGGVREQDKVDNDGGLSYYQFVNEEERAQPLKQAPAKSEHVFASHATKAKVYAKTVSANEDRFEDNNLNGGLDYPFEDDSDSNKISRDNRDKHKGSEDNLDGYALSSQTKDKSSNGLTRLKQSELLEDIVCDINNGKYKIGCKKDSSDVYIPFSFIQKYFEIYGKLEDVPEGKDQKQIFTWLHSQVKIHKPKIPYNPKGVFTYFENYNVEVRDRVKCISGSEGVPVSTQWDVNGYFYPIQIAQFGLSHFSKYLTEGEPKRAVLEDGGDEVRGGWIPAELVEATPEDNNDPMTNHIVQLKTPPSGSVSVSAKLPVLSPKSSSRMLVLSWVMKLTTGDMQPNVTLTATVRYESQVFYLHYVTANFLIQAKDNHIYHGLGYKSKYSWQHTIRDLGVDVQKGVAAMNQNKKKSKIPVISKSKLFLESLTLESNSFSTLISLDNVTLSTNEHLAQFFQAADWFVAHQDPRGGWPIPVRRKFGPTFYPVLESGWYSAMGQGHALSLLSRAYSITSNNTMYAEACAKAVETIFDRSGQDHGVRAVFMDKYVWYEEYPTTPSSFVLNGFMYSLLGLYDVKSTGVAMGAGEKAGELYDEGLKSLKAMLNLFDTGSGTMYDLRHVTLPGISPNLARVDYHVTHINQLLMFATFEKDPIFESTANRWIGYSEGNRAPHN